MVIPVAWLQVLDTFAFVLARVAGFFLVAPLFGGMGVPMLARVGLAALVSALLVGPVGAARPVGMPAAGFAEPFSALALAGELAVGAALGFIVLLFFSAVQVAGQLMDIPLGFGMVNVLDPQTGVHVPVLGQFQAALAFLVFFTINGHHGVLRALAASYDAIPLGGPAVAAGRVQALVDAFGGMFLLGVRVALPLMVASFLTDVALAIVSRAVPQINVFITGFPLKVMGGMLVLAIVLPAYIGVLSAAFGERGAMLRALWAFLGGS